MKELTLTSYPDLKFMNDVTVSLSDSNKATNIYWC